MMLILEVGCHESIHMDLYSQRRGCVRARRSEMLVVQAWIGRKNKQELKKLFQHFTDAALKY